MDGESYWVLKEYELFEVADPGAARDARKKNDQRRKAKRVTQRDRNRDDRETIKDSLAEVHTTLTALH
jgi:hypothetical protein